MDEDTFVDGAPMPGQSDARWYKVIAPKGMAPLICTFLSHRFVGFWTHWDGNTLPCTRLMDCPACVRGLGSRWTGFAAVWCASERSERVLALSEGAARQCLDLLTRRGTLRGCTVELRRNLPRANAPVVVKLLREQDPEKGPPEFDVRDSLNRLWGVNLRRWENADRKPKTAPMPDRIGDDLRGYPHPYNRDDIPL